MKTVQCYRYHKKCNGPDCEREGKWTVKKVREKVRDWRVLVRGHGLAGTVYPCFVGDSPSYRFAQVHFAANGVFLRIEVAWETLRDCLNANEPILY